MEERAHKMIDFGIPEDMTKRIIKVVGVGGGGCNAVKNMYLEGINNVTFAACNTDSQSLSKSPIPVKVMLGDIGLGVGGKPEKGREEAEKSIDKIKELFSDGTKMAFVTAGMGGGTGTGAGPIVSAMAREMGILTIGVVTLPFYFEKKPKIIKAIKGMEQMRKNVDALLIINNERLCDVFSDSHIPMKEAFRKADNILYNAVKSISELITIEGDINLDFCDVETTMREGGGAIMAIGRGSGEHRVRKAFLDALDSPLLYGSDINKAKRILFNIYTSEEAPLFVNELNEIDEFMDELSPQIEVIWGVSDDNSLKEEAKIAILATGIDNEAENNDNRPDVRAEETMHYQEMIDKLYKSNKSNQNPEEVAFEVNSTGGNAKIQEDTEENADERNENITPEANEDNAIDENTDDETKSDADEREEVEPDNNINRYNQNQGNSNQNNTNQNNINNGTKELSFVERLKKRIADAVDPWLNEPDN